MSENKELEVLENATADEARVEEECVEVESVEAEVVVEAEPECECKHEKVAEKGRNFREDPLTKLEGLLMFIFVIAIIAVSSMQMQSAFVERSDMMLNQIDRLEIAVADLEDQISDLEDKFEMYQSEEYKKPINITVNLDGEDKTVTVDPNAGEVVEQPTEPVAVFDESPFLGVGFFVDEEGNVPPNPIGLKVDIVYEFTPAFVAGIRPGDIIMAVDGIKMNSFDDLDAIISGHAAKEPVTIELATVSEGGIKIVTIGATLDYRGNYDLCPDCEE